MDLLWVAVVAGYSFVVSVVPGANNLQLGASGFFFGVRRTLPHMCGMYAGTAGMFALLLLARKVFAQDFPIEFAFLLAGFAYVLYLARLVERYDDCGLVPPAPPPSLGAAAAFQWVNPNAWFMVLPALDGFGRLPGAFATNLALVLLIFPMVGVAASMLWTGLGAWLRRYYRPTAGSLAAIRHPPSKAEQGARVL